MQSPSNAAVQARSAQVGAQSLSAVDLSPEPILAAVDNYRGIVVDLDQRLKIGPAALAAVRSQLRKELLGSGVQSGDRVVVALGNGPGFIAGLAATLDMGASPILVHYQVPPAELRRTAMRYGAAFAITDNYAEADLAAVGQSRTIECDWLRCVQTGVDTRHSDFDDTFTGLQAIPLHPTSGSTGLPKIAARPGACAIAEAVNYIDITGIDRHDQILVVTPMSHAYAYGMGLMVPLVSGATVLSMRKFVLKNVLDALETTGVTIFPAVPAMLDMLLFGKGGNLLDRPRMVLSAGAPLKRRTVENFLQVTGNRICPLYGTTETGGISVGPQGVTVENVDSVGTIMRGVEARIERTADPSLPEPVGRVAIRSTSMMAGYFTPKGIDASYLNDGWLATGDLGSIDDERNIRLIGRESEMINVAGMKVVPSEVEEVLARFPGVIECKVYAGERRSGSQFVKAVVAATADLDMQQLRAFCNEQLVYFKQPDVINRLDALPRSGAGKILKDQLP